MASRPNLLFILSDDHASHAMSCYGSRINSTPNLDRIAQSGMRFDNCFCTNSICTPSRASILTGTHNHVNGVTTLATLMDNSLVTFPKLLRASGYQTAVFGKWHLGEGARHHPTGFDDWAVVPGQGLYHNPVFLFDDGGAGQRRTVRGYVTDIIADMSINWLRMRDKERPFCLLCHHKAPHRPWDPDEKHMHMYLNEDVPEPDTLLDDYSERAAAAAAATMRVGVHMFSEDIKAEINYSLPEMELRQWAYQRYIKNYLRVVASVDDNVGRLLDYLDEEGLFEDTIVVYTSDQGFFLGDHGWYDKRFMYEESLRMPYVMSYPRQIEAGSVCDELVTNVDFAPTFLDLAGVEVPQHVQGSSFLPLLRGATPDDWQEAIYYRYWMQRAHHNVAAHYGVRTKHHKLIYYYYDAMDQPGTEQGVVAGPMLARSGPPSLDLPPEWELFDLKADPAELHNVYGKPEYAEIARELTDELHRLQRHFGDRPHPSDQTAGHSTGA